MTDTRSRHVPCDGPVAGMDVCADDNAPWPCDAIREADRADKAEADYGIWKRLSIESRDRADKAEAALAECEFARKLVGRSLSAAIAERDAAHDALKEAGK